MTQDYVSRPHARALVQLGRKHPEVLVLSADLTASCEADDFREQLPEQFLTMSMAEQNMVSMAAGLAREGFVPYLHTFAVFLTRRVFDQVAMSVAYPNLRVRFVGFLPGITTPGGVTHQATDDLALMRVLPNVNIVEVADATEVEAVLEAVHPIDGPVYVRMLRGEVPRLFESGSAAPLRPGRVIVPDGDVAVIAAGICTEEAMKAAAALKAHGLAVRLLHLNTLKPWPGDLVERFLHGVRQGVVVLENHSTIGGWGSAVAEHLSARGAGVPLVRLGLQDCYAHGASKAYLMREYGMDARALVDALQRLAGTDFTITDTELSTARLGAGSLFAKAEDL